jgi:hypothetical protein
MEEKSPKFQIRIKDFFKNFKWRKKMKSKGRKGSQIWTRVLAPTMVPSPFLSGEAS